MTLKDKIEMQAQDTTKIYLYKEGIFYKVYNEGAFLLNDLGYKVSVKYIKNLNQEIFALVGLMTNKYLIKEIQLTPCRSAQLSGTYEKGILPYLFTMLVLIYL